MALSSSHSTPHSRRAAVAHPAPHPEVLRWVRQIALAGLALVMVWPAARGHSEWLGWLPMWLVGMPCVAWWALYGFRLPARVLARQASRRRGPQARRRVRAVSRRVRPDLRQGGAGQAV
jgi:hypothetical protein